MRHSVGDKLVYMHEALALRLKLQKASYCQVAEKWDTDSESRTRMCLMTRRI